MTKSCLSSPSLLQVETAAGAAPPLSLLAPLVSGPQHTYWKATTNSTSVDFVIVLGSLSDVTGVILLVSPCGYSESDAPSVSSTTAYVRLSVFTNHYHTC